MKKWKIVIDGNSHESDCDSVEDAISEVAQEKTMDRRYSDYLSSETLRRSLNEDFKITGIAYAISGEEFRFSCNVNVYIEAEVYANSVDVEETTDPEVVEMRKLEAIGNHPDQIQIDLGGCNG